MRMREASLYVLSLGLPPSRCCRWTSLFSRSTLQLAPTRVSRVVACGILQLCAHFSLPTEHPDQATSCITNPLTTRHVPCSVFPRYQPRAGHHSAAQTRRERCPPPERDWHTRLYGARRCVCANATYANCFAQFTPSLSLSPCVCCTGGAILLFFLTMALSRRRYVTVQRQRLRTALEAEARRKAKAPVRPVLHDMWHLPSYASSVPQSWTDIQVRG
ncbi:hypothetical protein BKA62DRAFT_389521 [Auriculariales sp. MPI-PUGE-AT-0066]|nr:hypothetical protein BKA62DRAFT_389521 [Auriculariales sp. MPI-PUGE-AT-0066]